MLRRVASYAQTPRVLAARFSSTSRRPPPKATEDFLLGTNNAYLEQIYDQWKQGEEIDPAWVSILNAVSPQGEFKNPVPKFPRMVTGGSSRGAQAAEGTASVQDVIDHMKVALLVRAYEARGHLTADLDPLGLYDADLSNEEPPELNPAYFGFTEADLDREFTLGYNGRSTGFTSPGSKYKLRDLVQLLKKTYCSKIGWEIMHITDPEKQGFLRDRIQLPSEYATSKEYRQQLFRWLADGEWFERYLHKKYPTTKRFGLDGGESTIVGLKAVLQRGSELGVESVVIGMPHRGRLNVLANVVGKPLEAILHEFEHHVPEDAKDRIHQMEGSGDVKYHLGMSHDLKMSNGKTMHLSLVANPSHLEAVNPIAIGKTRAKQFYGKDEKREKNLTILLHGDAAFAGQGVCYETIGMSDLHAYTTGGTVHIIVNNQIGFTTDPYSSRTQPYCSDLGKTIQAPIFHVNGDDPEAVARVCNLAMEYRQEFKKDVIVDLLCYRRYGHNELDNPHFTQPRMYAAIAKHPLVLNLYGEKLLKDGVLNKEERDSIEKAVQDKLGEAFKTAKDYQPKPADWLETVWRGFKGPRQLAKIKDTKFGREFLTKLADGFLRVPENFTIHPQLKPQLVKRTESVLSGKDIDWATAELLAFGSLLLEGFHVRLSGQDVERGTFSQRHAVLHDRENGNEFIPLANVSKDQAEFSIHNSSLSEFGVLGFELGYSLENPNSLVMWEAQFGDFANGAQIIFDQFISSGEAKWLRQSGLTVLLPHGYDGQGPEHSSARLERFLQQVDEDEEMPNIEVAAAGMTPEQYRERAIQKSNMQVTFCTSPANHFHVLRRQIHREFRKPLICMVSKAHLRGPRNVSSIEEFTDGAFRPVIDDPEPELARPEDVRRVILCSGQVYFTLAAAREGKPKDSKNPNGEREPTKNTDVAIVRVEQLAPFPFAEVSAVLAKYPNAEVMWCQEEHKNMGAWQYVQPRIKNILRPMGRSTSVKYVGRKPAAATATGLGHVHDIEKAIIIERVFA